MWNVKTKVIPVTIGATGTISKLFIKYASNMRAVGILLKRIFICALYICFVFLRSTHITDCKITLNIKVSYFNKENTFYRLHDL
jgi:hypothetical protein